MKYTISVDEKVTAWIRRNVKVEADDYDEAVLKVIKDIEKYSTVNEYLEDSMSDYLLDTEEPMTVKENGGYDTIEVLNEQGDMIWNNVDKYLK